LEGLGLSPSESRRPFGARWARGSVLPPRLRYPTIASILQGARTGPLPALPRASAACSKHLSPKARAAPALSQIARHDPRSLLARIGGAADETRMAAAGDIPTPLASQRPTSRPRPRRRLPGLQAKQCRQPHPAHRSHPLRWCRPRCRRPGWTSSARSHQAGAAGEAGRGHWPREGNRSDGRGSGADHEIESAASRRGRVGKTAIVEGLAWRIARVGFRPCDRQANHRGDMGSLTAGTSLRGQFEERIVGIVKEASNAPRWCCSSTR